MALSIDKLKLSFVKNNITYSFHLSLLLLFLSAFIFTKDIIYSIISLVSSILIILFHEFGHSFFCYILGYKVYEIDVHIFGGSCTHDEVTHTREEVFISLGGIIFQIFLLFFVLSIYAILYRFNINNIYFNYFTWSTFIQWNLILIIFNLMPFPGFDGYSIFRFPSFSIFSKNKNSNIVNIKKGKKIKKSAQILSKDIVKKAKLENKKE